MISSDGACQEQKDCLIDHLCRVTHESLPLEGILRERVEPPWLQVLIIGIGCTMHDWTPRLLRALAAHREVIILDNAGIGFSAIASSSKPAPPEYFRFQAATVAGLVGELKLMQQPDMLGWCATQSWACLDHST